MKIVLITLAIILYIAGIFAAFRLLKKIFNTTFEKLWFSFLWPLVGILYGIHWLHMKL